MLPEEHFKTLLQKRIANKRAFENEVKQIHTELSQLSLRIANIVSQSEGILDELIELFKARGE